MAIERPALPQVAPAQGGAASGVGAGMAKLPSQSVSNGRSTPLSAHRPAPVSPVGRAGPSPLKAAGSGSLLTPKSPASPGAGWGPRRVVDCLGLSPKLKRNPSAPDFAGRSTMRPVSYPSLQMNAADKSERASELGADAAKARPNSASAFGRKSPDELLERSVCVARPSSASSIGRSASAMHRTESCPAFAQDKKKQRVPQPIAYLVSDSWEMEQAYKGRRKVIGRRSSMYGRRGSFSNVASERRRSVA
eukprot:TRINITY_DN28450_c0_g1_i1.p1 TRINITY_DN28450_c0_g1~~TRINITY_DN28450_c0_g1_i1.p1  ORF type:complete len:249 (-),score=26.53 TRINITY_DN28450_c0_g1_i1:120-866(-)